MPATLAVYIIELEDYPRNHHSLFICTDASAQSGFQFQVCGYAGTKLGMFYDHRVCESPLELMFFESKECVGWVHKETYESGRIKAAVEQVKPPEAPELHAEMGEREKAEQQEMDGLVGAMQDTDMTDPVEKEMMRLEKGKTKVLPDAQDWTRDVIIKLRREGLLTLNPKWAERNGVVIEDAQYDGKME